jgi:hypothetical protein
LALNIFKIRKFQLLKIETLVPIYNIHWVKLKKNTHAQHKNIFFLRTGNIIHMKMKLYAV